MLGEAKACLKEIEAVQERIYINLKEMTAEIRANNETFEVLQGTFFSRIDIHQARTEVVREEIISKRDAHHDGMETSINASRRE
jgi:multidrug resistance efflux pump